MIISISSCTHLIPNPKNPYHIIEREIRQGGEKLETRGGVLVQGLRDLQTDSIIDVKSSDADADSYIFDSITALLYRWDKIKKDKHGKNFHGQRKHFSPFVLSVGLILGREALLVLANLGRLVAAKMYEPISHVQGWINGQIVIAVAR